MIRKIAQYRVKSGTVDEVRETIRRFVDVVRSTKKGAGFLGMGMH